MTHRISNRIASYSTQVASPFQSDNRNTFSKGKTFIQWEMACSSTKDHWSTKANLLFYRR